jgi:RNA polymerase sigma-70 factor (ECF subfamily)
MTEIPQTRPSLLARLRDPQDERAWAEFVEIYQPLIHRLARQRGLQDADAAELVQEVFVAVGAAIDRWDPDPSRGKFRNWLFQIARNLMINLLAKQRRHPQGTGRSEIARLLERQPAADGEDSVLFDHEYRRQVFHWAADRIRGGFRDATWKAFWLTAVEGDNVNSVASQLGISVGAVYKARSRVMARLRQTVERLESE